MFRNVNEIVSYVIGYCVASLVFAQLAARFKPMTLMCVGLGIWVVAVVGTGLSPEFYFLFCARMCTGVGEASFVSLAPVWNLK